MSADSDETLMRRYQREADESAFTELYGRYRAKVFGYLMNRVRNHTLAEEIFQETFLKLHASKEKYASGLPFAPWLFTICRNTLLDALKKSSHRSEHVGLSVAQENSLIGSDLADFEEKLSSQSVGAELLKQLPENQKKAIELRYLLDMSFSEIARQLGTTPAATRQGISRGLRTLRQWVNKNGREKP